MNVQDVAYQKKRINRGVYGLLATVITIFALIFVVIQYQRNEADRMEALASSYHLVISNIGLGILSAIDKSRLWFRDENIGRREVSAKRGNEGVPPPLHKGYLARDQALSLKYEIEKYVDEISIVQAQFAEPGYARINSALQNAYEKFQAGIFGMQSDDSYTHRELDQIVAPLISATHQLQRLHQHAHLQQRMAIAEFQLENRVQITILIVVLSFIGLYGVASILRHVQAVLEELTRTQVQLTESERYNRMLFEQSPVGLALCRMNGELVDVNPAYARIIGRSVEEALMLSYWDITPKSYAESEKALLDQLRARGQYGPYEKEYIHKDGHLVPVRLQGSFLEQHGEKFIWSSVENITAQKWAEAEISRYREHLEELVVERTRELRAAQDELVKKERLSTLGQLTAMVSHELRNPLGVLRMSFHILNKKSDRDDGRVQAELQRVDRTIDRCDHIVDELLDFARITRLQRQTVPIDAWLESAIEEQAIPGAIRVEKFLTLENVATAIDPDRLRRVIINLTENACHAMLVEDDPDKIRRDAHLVFKTGGNADRLEIKISDNGAGMPADVSEKIFEPLFSTKSFGVGLGMSVVKQIIEQHEGGIDIETEAGHGTTVTLWLPRNTASEGNMEVKV